MSETKTQIVIGLLRLGAFLQRQGDRMVRPHGVSQQEFTVLGTIARAEEPLHQSNIGTGLLLERSNLSKIVKRLVDKGLVEVITTTKDRRIRLLRISEKGFDVFQRADAKLDVWNEEWLDEFDPSELEKTSELLNRLISQSN
jgi:DNA-binding MarR family transcriptional regulator